MKEIELTQNQVALVSDADYNELNKYKWCARLDKKMGTFYALRNSTSIKGKRCIIFMHNSIMNPSVNMVTDHKNHNTLDNRRCNLRVATHSQNMMNKKLYKNSTSGTTGVTWHKRNKKWNAQIQFKKKKINLGYFESKKDAIKARGKAESKYYGEFTYKNSISIQ